MYSRAMAITGGFLVLASGAGEVYRQKPRTRSLQATGQVFLGIYLICVVSPALTETDPRRGRPRLFDHGDVQEMCNYYQLQDIREELLFKYSMYAINQ